MKKTIILTFLLFTFYCSSSINRAIIIDSSSLQIPVDKIKLAKDRNKLTILEGLSTRKIPLKNINWIRISPKSVKNINGKTFYQTEIELKDGYKIISYSLENGEKSRSYVCINNDVIASTTNGSVRLKLSNVAKISFEQ